MRIEVGQFGPFDIFTNAPTERTEEFCARVVFESITMLRQDVTEYLFSEIGEVNVDWFRKFENFQTEEHCHLVITFYFRGLAQAMQFAMRWA